MTKNETAAFRRIVDSYHPQIRVFVATIAPSPDLADDIAQDVFLEAYGSLDRLAPGSDVGRWLRGIARNLVKRIWRERKRHAGAGPDRLSMALDDLAESRMDDERDLESRSAMLDHLRQCMEDVSPHNRQLIDMRFAQGYTPEEIAGALKRTRAAVYKALIRTREILAKCVKSRTEAVLS